jgi:hypothetical protein
MSEDARMGIFEAGTLAGIFFNQSISRHDSRGEKKLSVRGT